MPASIGGALETETMVDEVLDTASTPVDGGEVLADNPSEEEAAPQEEEVVEEAPEQEEVSGEEQEPHEKEAQQVSGGRAQKRIQSLVAEKRKLQDQLQNSQQEYVQQLQQQQYQMAQAYQQQMVEAQKQTEMLAKQLQLLTEKKEEDDPNLSPMEKYKRQLLKEAQQMAKQQLSPELEQIKQQLEAEKKMREAAVKQQEAQKTLQMFTQQTKLAREKYLLKDFDSKAQEELGESLDDMLLSFIAATGQPPETAATNFAKFLDKYHRARLGSVSKTKGAQVRKSQAMPGVTSSGKVASRADYRPSWPALRNAGFSSYTEWRSAGAKELSEPSKK